MTGKELKQRRQQLGLTQPVLAEILGTKQATISDWENEKIKIQHPKILDLALKQLENENAKNTDN